MRVGLNEVTEVVAERAVPEFDVVGSIIAYEEGELDGGATLELFSHLIKTGQCWSLQGHYGRCASSLIEGKLITEDGIITQRALDLLLDEE